MKKFLFAAAFLLLTFAANAQIFGDKMPVGTKNYTILVEGFDLEFKDFKGALDKYDFGSLDTSIAAQNIVIVRDAKRGIWRLPLSLAEARGESIKGKDPLETMQIPLGEVRVAKRDKID